MFDVPHGRWLRWTLPVWFFICGSVVENGIFFVDVFFFFLFNLNPPISIVGSTLKEGVQDLKFAWSNPDISMGLPRWGHSGCSVKAIPNWRMFIFGGANSNTSAGTRTTFFCGVVLSPFHVECQEPTSAKSCFFFFLLPRCSGNQAVTSCVYDNQVSVLDMGTMGWTTPAIEGDLPNARSVSAFPLFFATTNTKKDSICCKKCVDFSCFPPFFPLAGHSVCVRQ